METNTTTNNVCICKFCKNTVIKKYDYQSHTDRRKVYRDHVRSHCIDDEFKQQLKQDTLNELIFVRRFEK